jgi:cyanophycin synthetase
MWKAGKERGVQIRQVWALGKPINIFLAKLPNGKKIIFEGLPRPGLDSESLEWMDNKGIVKNKFRKAGFPVPRGRGCFTKSCALRTFKEIRKNGGMVVTKPTLGSRSRHTRVHIKTEAELLEAFKIAKQICPIVSVEEELRGTVFRVVLIGGEIAGVLRRDPPFVIGDGKMNIRDLVNQANQNPKRHGPIFHEIPFNSEMDEALKLQKMNRESVPDFGKTIIVGTKVGRSQGGTNVDVTDEMHIENRKLFWAVAKFLKDPLVGIDFMIEDIRKPWRSQMPCGIIELNSVPFLDLHMYPFEGKVRDLSAILWEEVLK